MPFGAHRRRALRQVRAPRPRRVVHENDGLVFDSPASVECTKPKPGVHRLSLSDQISHFSGEGIHRERLGEEVHAALEMAVVEHRIFCIACDEQHLQIRPCNPGRICHLAPIGAPWEANIGDQQVNRPLRRKHLEGRRALCSLDDRVAEVRKGLCGNHANQGLVVYEQYRLSTG